MFKVLKSLYHRLNGRTASGLEPAFNQAMVAFITKHESRCAEWKLRHPGKPLPIQIDPRTGELIWAARKSRRS